MCDVRYVCLATCTCKVVCVFEVCMGDGMCVMQCVCLCGGMFVHGVCV